MLSGRSNFFLCCALLPLRSANASGKLTSTQRPPAARECCSTDRMSASGNAATQHRARPTGKFGPRVCGNSVEDRRSVAAMAGRLRAEPGRHGRCPERGTPPSIPGCGRGRPPRPPADQCVAAAMPALACISALPSATVGGAKPSCPAFAFSQSRATSRLRSVPALSLQTVTE